MIQFCRVVISASISKLITRLTSAEGHGEDHTVRAIAQRNQAHEQSRGTASAGDAAIGTREGYELVF